jgi:peptidoglycan/LPS O-acetylase OafA/YrhL
VAPPEAPQAPTITFIQYLRGLAPIPVVWAHLSGFWLLVHSREWEPQNWWTAHLAGPIGLYQDAGHLGVVIFFFVSGYIVSYSSGRETRWAFTIKRLLRLLPALWLSVLVVAAARFADHRITGMYPTGTAGTGIGSYLRGAFLLDMLGNTAQVNGVTWTLVIEVMFYALTAAAMVATRRAPGAATLGMLAVWAVAAVAMHHFPSARHMDFFTVYVGFLILGRVLYLAHSGIITTRSGLRLGAVVTVVSVAVYAHCMPVLLQTVAGPANSYLLGFLIFAVFMFAAPKHAPWAVRKLADVSYSLYLLHVPLGMLAIDLAIKAGAPFMAAFAAGVLVSVAGAVASYRWVELPAQRLARRWTGKGKRRKAAPASVKSPMDGAAVSVGP